MLPENEARIRDLCGNTVLAEQILSVIAEDTQRHQAELAFRQTEGLRRAKEQGIQLGRPPIKRPRKFKAVYQAYCNNEISARAASQQLGVSPGTFKRWVIEASNEAN
jgi:DNA invertase Pin-like site-specific DNA recombinase